MELQESNLTLVYSKDHKFCYTIFVTIISNFREILLNNKIKLLL